MKQPIIANIIVAVLSLTFLGIIGYGQEKPIKKGLKLAFVPKNINNPYNVIETGGSMVACKEMDADGKVVGPSDTSASSQCHQPEHLDQVYAGRTQEARI